jgi:DNA-directed RNA polymerase subunit beta'
MLFTEEYDKIVNIGSAKPTVKKDDPVFEGDEIAEGVVSTETGIVTKVGKNEIVVHRARPYLVNQGSQLLVSGDSLVKQGEVLAVLTYEQMKTGDIIQGLPRVEELLETRKPKEGAVLSEYDGVVKTVIQEDDSLVISVMDEEGFEHLVTVPMHGALIVVDGQQVTKGEPLTTGAVNPHELLKIKNIEAAQRYLVDGVQKVYRSQGVKISDKHIEVIVRQMTRKRRIDNPGESIFLPGEVVTEPQVRAEKQRMEKANLDTSGIEYTPILLGITKASLNTESFISAASFQETTRVLTEAAMEGKRDWLRGLKENVIIGRLIPAGTGMRTAENRRQYREKRHNVEKAEMEAAQSSAKP